MILKAGFFFFFFFFFCLNFSAHILLILKLRVNPPGSVAIKKIEQVENCLKLKITKILLALNG